VLLVVGDKGSSGPDRCACKWALFEGFSAGKREEVDKDLNSIMDDL
jgi:hypothetical protein